MRWSVDWYPELSYLSYIMHTCAYFLAEEYVCSHVVYKKWYLKRLVLLKLFSIGAAGSQVVRDTSQQPEGFQSQPRWNVGGCN